MIDKEKAKAAIAEMCQNPDWKEVLANAPGAANLRIGLAFYASKNLADMDQKQKDEYREFREMLERQLNAVELKYLAEEFRRMGVEAAASHYAELLAAKPQEEQASAEQEYQEIVKKASEDKKKVADFQAKYGEGGGEETPAETPTETPEGETAPAPENDGEKSPEENPGENPESAPAQDESPAQSPAQPAQPASPEAEAAPAKSPSQSPSPEAEAPSSASPAPAAQPDLPGFSDDDLKSFLERGKAMLGKGLRLKAKPKA